MTNIDEIVERNFKLVPFVIQKMGLSKYKDEYIDIGWIGLVWGAKNYDETKGAESTFLYKSIKLYLMQSLLYKTKKKRTGYELLSLDYEYIDEDGDIFTLHDMIGKNITDEVVNRHDLEECIRKVIKSMGITQKKIPQGNIIKDYYGFDTIKLSTNNLLNKYNISRMTLTNIKKKFRKELIKELDLEEYVYGNKGN